MHSLGSLSNSDSTKNFSDTDTITMFEFWIDIIFDGRDFQQIVVPSGHYGFHSFRLLTDFVCLYTYEF